MGVKKKDYVRLPGETQVVLVRGIDLDDKEITLFFERSNGTKGEIILSDKAFHLLTPLYATGTGEPRIVLAGLWGYWMRYVIAHTRQTILSTTSLSAYAHQDEAVYGAMLPQPTLRFLLADEPGTGKTVMAGMYIVEMRRRRLLQRALLVVPAHLVPKWERDLHRFFGIETERLTAEMCRSSAPLRPDRDFWVVSVDLLARNVQVQQKALFAGKGAWDLVVFDEAHRLTPTAQNVFLVAETLARQCTHLLLLTATPHRGNEYLFRALLHLIDPEVYIWSPDDARLLEVDAHRLRPAPLHFLRRMKESLKHHDNKTPLFPQRQAHNLAVPLSITEQELYEDVMAYCDRFFDDASGLVRSVYGRRGASSLYALLETLKRRVAYLYSQHSLTLIHEVAPTLSLRDLVDDEEEGQPELEQHVSTLQSNDTTAEIFIIDELCDRLSDYVSGPSFLSAKWQEVCDTVLPVHGIAPGQYEQLLVFTEYVDTAVWLEQKFLARGFSVRRYTGELSRDERERIQADFQNKRFEILVSTDAGNEGIDLQSAHVLVNWDIPWSIVRLEQRIGRLHRIGQQSKVDIYNLISTSTREGRVQEIILNNIVAAAEALNGQIFDCLGSVVEQLGVDYIGLLVRAGAGGDATDKAIEQAQQITARQYQEASIALRQSEDTFASRINRDAFITHLQQDQLDAVNPAVVTAFLQALAAARNWSMKEGLHNHLYVIESLKDDSTSIPAGDSRLLPVALGNGVQALVAVSADALVQARKEGADLSRAIILGPAEPAYRALVDEIVYDANNMLALGTILNDPSAFTPYELLLFDAALVRHQGERIVEWDYPILVRADGSGIRTVLWQCITHLHVPLNSENHNIPFPPEVPTLAEQVAKTELEHQAKQLSTELQAWMENMIEDLDQLQDEVIEPYLTLPLIERKKRRTAVNEAISERKRLLQQTTSVSVRTPRFIGRIQVHVSNGGKAYQSEISSSEAQSMYLCIQHLESQGFHVEDVHQEGCGYDLLARRGHELRCVEVKGLQGDISPGIMLESSEWLMAQQLRENYWLYIFTHCASIPRLFAAYPDPITLFGESKKLVQRFHIPGSVLRKGAF